MKRKLIIAMLGILLVGFVVAGVVLQTNKTVDVLVTPHSYEDVKTDDWFQRCLITETDFKLPCSERFSSYRMECNLFNVTLVQNDSIVYETQEGLTESNLPIGTVAVECLNEARVDLTDDEMESELDVWHNKTLFRIDNVFTKREAEGVGVVVRGGEVSQK